MLSTVLLGVALAGVPYAPTASPLWTDWAMRAQLSVGADAWTGGGGAAFEGTLAGWWGRPVRRGRAFAGYTGLMESVPASPHTTWDAHAIDLGIETGGSARAGVSAHLAGGVLGAPRWAGALLGPTVATDLGATGWLAAQVGPTWRGEVGASSAGLGAVVSGGWATPEGLRLRGQAQLRRYVGSDLPDFLAELDAAAGLPLRDTMLTIASGTAWTGPGSHRVAGLPEPGSVLVRAQLAVDTKLRGPVTWRLEAGAERGTRAAAYVRGRVFTGFAVRLGAIQPPSPAVQSSGPVTFRLHAPEAGAVAIAGAFTGWEPQDMFRSEDGAWWITVPLAPGEYEYAYVVDGTAVLPPESPIRRPDGYGGGNGVILVTPASAGR